MAEAVLAVFPSHSEIGRTRCTMNKIIFVRLHSSFAIPSASKITSHLWHVHVHQTSFEALPHCWLCNLAPCFPPSCSKGVLLLTPTRKLELVVPANVGMKGGPETSSSGGTVSMSGTFFRDRRLIVEPVERGRHCQRMVCVSGGLNCLWACFSVLGGWSIYKLDALLMCLIEGMHLSWREITGIWPIRGSVVSVNSMQTNFLQQQKIKKSCGILCFQKLWERGCCILASSVRSCGCCPLHGAAVLAIHLNDMSQWETRTQHDGEDGLFYLIVNYLPLI